MLAEREIKVYMLTNKGQPISCPEEKFIKSKSQEKLRLGRTRGQIVGYETYENGRLLDGTKAVVEPAGRKLKIGDLS
jgi:hypothetical protein